MRIDVLTLFPEMLAGPFDHSIIARARASGAVEIAVHTPRAWTRDRHQVVDDYAYGGGPGMVMKPEPLFEAVEDLRADGGPRGTVVLLTPQGRLLDQALVRELAREDRLIIICGHYEGVDERVREHLADVEVSIGDYVLSGGEPAAMVLVDAVTRLQPGVLGSEHSLTEESHTAGLLEYPQYTRPAEYRGMQVPEVLLSGDHAAVARWRREQSIKRTARRRPDMLARAQLMPEEQRIVEEALADADHPVEAARLFRIGVPVPDLARAVEFYRAILGHDGVAVAGVGHYFRCGPTILALGDHGGQGSVFRANVEPACFAVADLRAAYARAKGAGCSWLEDRIRKRAWGEKSFYGRDPFGNPFCFVDERTAFSGEPSRG